MDGIAMIAANIKSLKNHPWGQFASDAANRTGTANEYYGDGGEWAACAFAMTGDPAYAAKTFVKLCHSLGKDPSDPNDVRENFADRALAFGLIRSALTPDQDSQVCGYLNRWCEWCCAINTAPYVGGWRYADSDQTLGQYLGCALTDKLTGSTWIQRPDVIKARAAITDYCMKAKGGEWVESTEYNCGTVKILLLGAYAVGIEEFPEIAALVPDLAAEFAFMITPDFKQSYQWGDNQDVRSLHLIHRVPCSAMLAGLAGSAALHDTIARITAGVPMASYMLLGWRALYLYQPPKPVSYLRTTPGVGVGIYKRDSAMCGVKLSPLVGVDHSTAYHSDVQLYLDGEWALTHPIGYSASWLLANTPLFCGLPNMQSRNSTWEETADGFKVTSTTSGPYYRTAYYDPPPAFVQNFMRTIEFSFANRRITISDSFVGNDPRKLPKFSRYAASELGAMNKAENLWQQLWHAPVAPTETPTGYIWQTRSGKTVTLAATGWTKRVVLKESDVLPTSQFNASELAGYQIRLGADGPSTTIHTTIEVK